MKLDFKLEEQIEPEHPVFPAIPVEKLVEVLRVHGPEVVQDLVSKRNQAISFEQRFPLDYGYELPTWKLADLFLGFISWDVFVFDVLADAKRWSAVGREEIAEDLVAWTEDERLRKAAADGPYQVVLMLGGNQAGKTEWACSRMTRFATKYKDFIGWFFHESGSMSIKYHQKHVNKYMPDNWRNVGKGQTGYYAYKLQTGFSDMTVTGPNGAQIEFRNYEQRGETIEGGEVGDPLQRRSPGIITDELVPFDWFQTLRMRLARRQASLISMFTPIHGYTETVAWFLDGAKTVREEMGHELDVPRPMPLVRVRNSGTPCAVINFHSRYNPYPNRGAYQNLVAMVQSDTDVTRAIRLYGHTDKQRQSLFPKLWNSVHGFELDELPEEGTNYCYIDPTGRGRNWFMLWVRVDVWGRLWIYREWPCPKIPVPTVGLPGMWAEPGSDNKQNKFGGLPGPAQRGFGFGLKDYKSEMARLERWDDARLDKPIEEWSNANGAKEIIYGRRIDSRFANTGHDTAAGTTTLLEELADIKVFCEPASGKSIDEGIDLINDALAFEMGFQQLDMQQQVDKGPRLRIANDCQNLWFCMNIYTSMGGQSEASKDPIDCLRYMLIDDPMYVPNEGRQNVARGYGMRLGSYPPRDMGKKRFTES